MTLQAAWQALERDDFAAAESAAREALARSPEDAEALYLLGSALLFAGRAAEALAPLREAFPRLKRRGVGYRLGHCHLALGEWLAAEQALRRETEAYPESANAHNALGVALVNQSRHEEALAAFLAALKADPGHAEAAANVGNVLVTLGRHAEALPYLRRAHYALGSVVWAEILACRWREAAPLVAALREQVRENRVAVAPFTLVAVSDSAAELRQCAELHVRTQLGAAAEPLRRGARHRQPRIRLGYLSADFHEHATAKLAARLFELHDRTRFELVAFSYGEDDGSPMRRRLAAAFDRFVDVRGRSDADAARLLAESEVGIAVDLKGHTPSGRPGILAPRPAPLQASWLGFPGTTGAPFIDYLIADDVVVPPGEERHYSERIVRLPHCYQVNDATREIAAYAPSRAQVGLHDDDFVFCCFNQPYKITPEVFDVWMRLLDKVPRSRLWLLEDNAAASDSLRAAARERGIDPARLVFAPRLPHAEHLARHRLADLFLDTLPCNAHTTASDALWAGLPVLTCAGATFAARVAASLLAAVGLPELVTRSFAEYEALALSLSRDRRLLEGHRQRLARNRLEKPLFDTDRFQRGLEAAYATMWEMHLRGEAPRSFSVASP